MIVSMPLANDIFLKNKYASLYIKIVAAARGRWPLKPSQYSEKHHVIPRALGGSDDQTNLVWLTAREHFICHRLLPKMLAGPEKTKMQFALLLMINPTSKDDERLRLHSGREYEVLREELAKACGEALRQRWAEGKMWTPGGSGTGGNGKGRIWTDEQRARLSKWRINYWSSMEESERRRRAEHNRKNGSPAYSNLTNEEREAHRLASAEGSRKFWGSVTAEQVAEMNAKNLASKRANGTDLNAIQKEAYANMPEETKVLRAEKIRAAKKTYWADPENRLKQRERIAANWLKRKTASTSSLDGSRVNHDPGVLDALDVEEPII